MNNTKFPVWKTVKTGTFDSIVELEEALFFGKCLKNNFAKSMIKSSDFNLNEEESEINLILLSPKELGFNYPVSYKEICEVGLAQGLKLCPVETGPQLCLQYNNLTKNTDLIIATKPVFIPITKEPCIFHVELYYNIIEIWLNGCWGRPEGIWGILSKFIFCY